MKGQNRSGSARRPSCLLTLSSHLLLATVSFVVFWQSRYPLLFLIPPPLILVATKTGLKGINVSVSIIAVMAFVATSLGTGPLTIHAALSEDEKFILVSLFIFGCYGLGYKVARIAMAKRRVDRELEIERERSARQQDCLAESEARYRLLAEHANDVVARCGPDGAWIYISPSAERIFGAPRESLTGKGTFDFVHPDDRAAMLERIGKLQTGAEEDERPTFRIVRPDGAEVWLEASSHVVRHSVTGEPDGYVSLLRDITQRVNAEAAASESEERYRILVQTAVVNQAIYMLDPDGCVQTWNIGAERIKGYTEAEIIGQNYEVFFSAADVALKEPARALSIARDKGHFGTRAWRQRKDGSRFFADVTLKAIRHDDGTLRGFAKITRDITKEAAEQEQRAIIIEAAPNGMMIIDESGKITLANAALEELFDYPKGGLNGLAVEVLVPEAVQSRHGAVRRRYSDGEDIQSMARRDILGRKRDGSEVSVEILLNPVDTGTGRIVIVSVFDISERKRLAAAQAEAERQEHEQIQATNKNLERLSRHLSRARDRADQANRAKSRFLAGMSHELRTPLNGILGYAQLLHMEGDLNAKQAARVDAMLAAGRHLLEMIACVLDLSEIEAESTTIEIAKVDIQAIANASLDLIRPAAESNGLALHLVTRYGTPTHLMTDATRLRQVLLNLLGNAVKFTAHGIVELRLYATAERSALRIEIADTGPGIPADQRQRLFQDFERLDTEATFKAEGAGLGLALSNRLVALMEGRLGHDDNPGGGSIFWLELPLRGTSAPERAAAPGTSGPRLIDEPRQAFNVLVVDDVLMNLDIASSFLEAAGHNVTCAEGGAQGVAAASSADFDVVLMDVRMPEVDGREAARRIRALPGRRGQVPIVAVTAQAFADQVAACHEAGMGSHVTKPFDPDTLIAAVQRAAMNWPDDVSEPRSGAASGAASTGPAIGFPEAKRPVFDRNAFERTAIFLSSEAVASYLQTIATLGESFSSTLRSLNLSTQSNSDLAETAHLLAGSAGMFGFERLSLLSRRFERAVGANALEVPFLANELCHAVDASLEAINKLHSEDSGVAEQETIFDRETERAG